MKMGTKIKLMSEMEDSDGKDELATLIMEEVEEYRNRLNACVKNPLLYNLNIQTSFKIINYISRLTDTNPSNKRETKKLFMKIIHTLGMMTTDEEVLKDR